MLIINPDQTFNENDSDLAELPRLQVDAEPVRLQIISDPFLFVTTFGYQPAVKVFEMKKKREYMLFLSAKSLSNGVESIRISNGGYIVGIEFWVKKESYEKKSPYIVEEY